MHNTAYILNVYTEHVREYLGMLMHNRFISKLIDTMSSGGEYLEYIQLYMFSDVNSVQSSNEFSRKKTS